MTYSVIIPVLNEAAVIGKRIDEVRAMRPNAQVIIADGGSRDGTRESASAAGALVVTSRPGRGLQCNAGAERANGDILLFLHADTMLPRSAFDVLDRAFLSPRTLVGTFRLAFDQRTVFSRLCTLFTRLDTVFTRFGDQCITLRGDFFRELGGFRELRYFEDVDLLRRARRLTRIHSFPAAVVTSGRRFRENGPVRQFLFDCRLMLLYALNVPPERLAEEYARFKRGRGK